MAFKDIAHIMRSYWGALIVGAILIAGFFAITFGPLWVYREKPVTHEGFPTFDGGYVTEGIRENYGPPPGMYRAVDHNELDYRGWPEAPYEYVANSASSISHMIERSA